MVLGLSDAIGRKAALFFMNRTIFEMIKNRLKKIMKDIIYKIVIIIIITFVIMFGALLLSILNNIKLIEIKLKDYEETLKDYRKTLDAISEKFIKYRIELNIIMEMIMEK